MSGVSRKRLRKQDPEAQVIENFNEAYRFYLRNRKKMTSEKLADILPLLEQTFSADHGSGQFDSNLLFLKLCFKYRAILPEAYASFKDNDLLLQKFLILRDSELFKQTTLLKRGFIEKAYRELSHMRPLRASEILRLLQDDATLKDVEKDVETPREQKETLDEYASPVLIGS